jgi:hypothetical protein
MYVLIITELVGIYFFLYVFGRCETMCEFFFLTCMSYSPMRGYGISSKPKSSISQHGLICSLYFPRVPK